MAAIEIDNKMDPSEIFTDLASVMDVYRQEQIQQEQHEKKLRQQKHELNETIISRLVFNRVDFEDKVQVFRQISNNQDCNDWTVWKRIEFNYCTGPVDLVLQEIANHYAMKQQEQEQFYQKIGLSDKLSFLKSPVMLLDQLSIITNDLSTIIKPLIKNNNVDYDSSNGFIKSLSIWGTHITAKSSKELFSNLFAAQPHLQELHFKCSNFDTIDHLVHGLQTAKNSQLTMLNLFSCNLWDFQAIRIIQALQHVPTLQHLDIAKNACDVGSLQELATLLSMPSCQIHTLNLSYQRPFQIPPFHANLNNNNDNNNAAAGGGFIKEMNLSVFPKYGFNSNLKRLYLRGNKIGNDGMDALCQTLVSSKVEDVNLKDCDISMVGLQSFATLLPQMKHLKFVSLEGSQQFHFGNRNPSIVTTTVESLLERGVQTNMSIQELSLPFGCSLRNANVISSFLDCNHSGRKQVFCCHGDDNNNDNADGTPPLSSALWPLILERIWYKDRLPKTNATITASMFLANQPSPQTQLLLLGGGGGSNAFAAATSSDYKKRGTLGELDAARRTHIIWWFLRHAILLERQS